MKKFLGGVVLLCFCINLQAAQIHDAALKGRSEQVKLLLDEGVNIDSRDEINRTPLHCAVLGADFPTIKLLVQRGSDRTAKCKFGYTPRGLAQKKRNEARSRNDSAKVTKYDAIIAYFDSLDVSI